MSKTHYSAKELAGLPGMPGTERTVKRWADSERWPRQSRAGRGGGYEYPITCLPEITRTALLDAAFGSSPTARLPLAEAANEPTRSLLAGSATTNPPTPPRSVVVSAASTQVNRAARPAAAKSETAIVLPQRQTADSLKHWQRDRMEARIAIVRHVEAVARTIGVSKAIAYVVGKAATYELPDEIQALVPIANARAGKGDAGKAVERSLSDRTLFRWLTEFKQGGTVGLAPKAVQTVSVPAWAPALMDAYQKPSKPALLKCVNDLRDAGVGINYDAARRFLLRVGALELQHGRMGERELKKLAPFVRRDWSQLEFGDVYQMDGHQVDAEVAHPITGRPVRPEVTPVLDCATRAVVGYSAGFAESSWVVMDALRDAAMRAGVPALLYTDRGSGYINDKIIGRMTGLVSRIGTTHTTSIPYNSQARGLIERLHQSVLIPLAKGYPTYMGKDMDPQARQKAFKITRNDVQRAKLLPTWTQFLQDLEDAFAKYNATVHSELRCSPDEAVARSIAAGAQVLKFDEGEARDLFRPTVPRVVARGEIELFTNRYFSKELKEYHGDKVLVAYEVRDPSHVYVRTLEGQLICEAHWDGNKNAGFPKAVIDQAREKRARGQIKRLQSKIDAAREEAEGIGAIEHEAPSYVPAIVPASNHSELASDNVTVGDFTANRPMFRSEGQKYEWLMVNKTQWTDDDLVWLSEYVNGEFYAELRPLYQAKGLEWPEGTGFRVAAA